MGTFWQLRHFGNKHHHLGWTCREWFQWKQWSEGEQEIVASQPVFVSADPPPVTRETWKQQKHVQSEMCRPLTNRCLSELEVLVSELNAFNLGVSVIAIDHALCHTCLLVFLFLFTSLHIDWLLGFYKFINHLLLRGFLAFVCVDWEYWKRLILESQ